MSDPEITVSPAALVAGDKMTLGHTGSMPQTLRYRVEPPGTTWITVELTDTHPTWTGTLPTDAVAVTIEDQTGGAPFRDLPVSS